MKKLLVCLLALLLAAAPALGEEAADGSAHAFEGSGFDSPEEAVTAYLEAMQEGDVQGMLSTFAIETYVDNVDAQTYLTRMGAFVPDDQEGVPLSNAYAREITISRRYAGLADQLYMQYLYYSWPEEYGEFTGDALRLNEAGGADAFLSAMSASTFADALAGMEIVGFADPAALNDNYASQINQETIARQMTSYGCDEVADIAVRLNMGGEEWYQCMWAARYGEKWYNLSLSGNIGALLAIRTNAGGLVPAAALPE